MIRAVLISACISATGASLLVGSDLFADDLPSISTRSLTIETQKDQRSTIDKMESWYGDKRILPVRNEAELQLLDEDENESLAKRESARRIAEEFDKTLSESDLSQEYHSIKKVFSKVRNGIEVTGSSYRDHKVKDQEKPLIIGKIEPDVRSGAILRLKTGENISCRVDPVKQDIMLQYSIGF